MDFEGICSFTYPLLLSPCLSDSLLQMKLNQEKNAVEMYHFSMNQLENPYEYFIKITTPFKIKTT